MEENQMRSKSYFVFALLLVATMLLTACQQAATPIVQTVVVEKEGKTEILVVTATPAPQEPAPAGPKVLYTNFKTQGDVPSLDPAVAEDTASIQMIEELNVGLARLNEEDVTIVPGIAESWDISDDGLTYTFHLRQDVPWVKYNGTEVVKVQNCEGADRLVTAQDFEYGFLRTLKPETASPYAYVLAFAVAGAADYNNAKTDDPTTVGVKALDEATLEVKFLEDAAYNINIISLWTGYAQPKWLIEGDDCTDARGERWTETGFNQSYGPFALKEWVHDSFIALAKNPFWPGSDEIPVPTLDEINFTMLDETAAFAEYEAGNLDVILQVPQSDIDRVKADPVLSAEYVQSPALSTYYYGFNITAPVVDDVRVRRALSMAVDRQGLIDNVTKGGQEPAQWFCRPGLIACPTVADMPDLGVKFDPTEAKKLMDEYLAEKGLTVDQLDLTLMFNTSSGHQKIAEAIQQMWKDNLGVTVKLVNQEWKVYLETIKSADTPQIWRLGWNLDYPDTNNFDREVVAAGGSSNPTDENGVATGGFFWKNDKYEELVKLAASEKDLAKRTDLYAQAEKILVWDDAVMIPIYWYTNLHTTKPYVTRTFSNTGAEHFEKWDINK